MMTPKAIDQLLEQVGRLLPGAILLLDGPSNAGTIWWIDAHLRGKTVSLFWREDRGFGMWTKHDDDPGFGVHADEYTFDLERVSTHIQKGLTDADDPVHAD